MEASLKFPISFLKIYICKMAAYFGKNPDELLAMADKVAADVLAIIIKQPAYARFLRAHAHLTKDEWETL
jgi:hypothetical protein